MPDEIGRGPDNFGVKTIVLESPLARHARLIDAGKVMAPPTHSPPPLDPFAPPPEEGEISIEGKVALEAIPSMRRWTSYEHEAMVPPRPWWKTVALLALGGILLGAAVLVVLRLL